MSEPLHRDFSLRVPEAWLARVDSTSVRVWLHQYLARAYPLPPDPGPGDGRMTLYLPRREANVLAALNDRPLSSALRSLIASRLDSPALLPAPRAIAAPAEAVRTIAATAPDTMEPAERFQAFLLLGLVCLSLLVKFLFSAEPSAAAQPGSSPGLPAPEAGGMEFKPWIPLR